VLTEQILGRHGRQCQEVFDGGVRTLVLRGGTIAWARKRRVFGLSLGMELRALFDGALPSCPFPLVFKPSSNSCVRPPVNPIFFTSNQSLEDRSPANEKRFHWLSVGSIESLLESSRPRDPRVLRTFKGRVLPPSLTNVWEPLVPVRDRGTL